MDASIAALVDRWSRPRPRRRVIEETGVRFAPSGERVVRYHDLEADDYEAVVDERAMWHARPPTDEELERLERDDEHAEAARMPARSRAIADVVFTIFGFAIVLSVRRSK